MICVPAAQAATLAFDSIVGTYTVSQSTANGSGLVQDTLTENDVDQSALASIGNLTSSGNFSNTTAAGSFSADDTGLAQLTSTFNFSPTADAPLVIAFDFTQLENTDSGTVTFTDVTNSDVLFTRTAGANAGQSGSQQFSLLASNDYAFAFSGTIINDQVGGASASIQLIPEPSTAALVLIGLTGLTRRRRTEA